MQSSQHAIYIVWSVDVCHQKHAQVVCLLNLDLRCVLVALFYWSHILLPSVLPTLKKQNFTALVMRFPFEESDIGYFDGIRMVLQFLKLFLAITRFLNDHEI